MSKLKNWIGVCALLLSLQVYGNEIIIQDAWIRTIAPGQENAIVGMVITSPSHARIIGVISPAYKFVAMQGPGKNDANKTQEVGFIDLPAQKAVMLSAESVHMLLIGRRHTPGATDNVPVIFTVQFDDKTNKIITIMVRSEHSNNTAAVPLSSNATTQAGTEVPPTEPRNSVEIAKKDAATTVTPPTQRAPAKTMESHAKPVVAPKPPVAEVKPLKTVPVAVIKPKPAPVPATVAETVVAAPLAVPVAVVVPVVAPVTPEPKKAPEAKPVEQPKPVETLASDDCLKLAHELRECSRLNDMMVAWCETEAKSKYACQLTREQLRKR